MYENSDICEGITLEEIGEPADAEKLAKDKTKSLNQLHRIKPSLEEKQKFNPRVGHLRRHSVYTFDLSKRKENVEEPSFTEKLIGFIKTCRMCPSMTKNLFSYKNLSLRQKKNTFNNVCDM